MRITSEGTARQGYKGGSGGESGPFPLCPPARLRAGAERLCCWYSACSRARQSRPALPSERYMLRILQMKGCCNKRRGPVSGPQGLSGPDSGVSSSRTVPLCLWSLWKALDSTVLPRCSLLLDIDTVLARHGMG